MSRRARHRGGPAGSLDQLASVVPPDLPRRVHADAPAHARRGHRVGGGCAGCPVHLEPGSRSAAVGRTSLFPISTAAAPPWSLVLLAGEQAFTLRHNCHNGRMDGMEGPMDNQANWILQPVCRWSSDTPQMVPQQLWRDTVTGARVKQSPVKRSATVAGQRRRRNTFSTPRSDRRMILAALSKRAAADRRKCCAMTPARREPIRPPSWHHLAHSTTPYFLYKISPVVADT
jgi:hypothetical protein